MIKERFLFAFILATMMLLSNLAVADFIAGNSRFYAVLFGLLAESLLLGSTIKKAPTPER